jgi:hypothetical protein
MPQKSQFDENGYGIQSQIRTAMPRCCSQTRRRGNQILTRIVAGFSSSLVIEKVKQIRDWTSGLRERVIWEAWKIRQEGSPDTSRLQPVSPNESADSTSSPNEMADDSWHIVERSQGDHRMEDSETDLFEFIECDSEMGSEFSENTTIR